MIRGGFLLIDKPAGPTSNDVLQQVKRRMTRNVGSRLKYGHAGTLDSFASGLLVVLVGNMTRLTPWFMHQTKEYEAVFCFGKETDTLDPNGRVIAECEPPTEEQLASVLPRFEGRIMQVPPAYSAVHSGGERAYRQAMRGQQPELQARPVMIEQCALRSWDGRRAMLSIRCSAGTYVRALARDAGLACGSRAYVEALRRMRIGPFGVEDAVAPELCSLHSLRAFTPEIASKLGLRPGILQEEYLRPFLHGARLPKTAVELAAQGFSSANPVLEDGERSDELALFAPIDDQLRGSTEELAFLGILQGGRDHYRVRLMAAERTD